MLKLFRRKRRPNSCVVMVLGMHRSGTSCLTGLLQQTGLELGDVVTEAPHNKKGNRENLDIMRLNDDVLAHSRGSWDRPQKLSAGRRNKCVCAMKLS